MFTGIVRARASGQEKDGALEDGDQLEVAPAVFLADLDGYFGNARGHLFFGEQNSLDVFGHGGHDEATIRSPYLNTRSWKSFW